jgi:hypothetical protein
LAIAHIQHRHPRLFSLFRTLSLRRQHPDIPLLSFFPVPSHHQLAKRPIEASGSIPAKLGQLQADKAVVDHVFETIGHVSRNIELWPLRGCKIFVIHQVGPAWIAESRSGAVNVILGGTSVGQPYAYTMQLAKDSGAFRHPCTAVLRTFFAFASFFSIFDRRIYLCTLCDASIARTRVALPDHESARN